MIKVLLADDQVLFVNSLKDVLMLKDRELEVVKVVYNGRDAISYLRGRQHVDVVVLDVRMQPLDGVEATKIIHAEFPDTRIILLTIFDDDRYVTQAMEHGASGYLLKDMTPEEFIAAIRAVYKGNRYLSPSVVDTLVKSRRTELPVWFKDMTEKELQVLRLLSIGYNNDEIAAEALLGRQTVKNYVHSIYEKMGVRDRMQAMRLCIELKLFED